MTAVATLMIQRKPAGERYPLCFQRLSHVLEQIAPSDISQGQARSHVHRSLHILAEGKSELLHIVIGHRQIEVELLT